MSQVFFVYILYSPSLDKYYIGQTYDLQNRLAKHLVEPTRFTKRASDWEIVYSEEFSSRRDAVNRERKIKQMKSREYILELINSSLTPAS